MAGFEDLFMGTDLAGIMALAAVAMMVFVIFSIIMYVYGALVFMAIAKRTNTPNGWLAWIPIANIYLITQIAGVPWWTIFGVFLGVIPFVGQWLLIALFVFWWWKICEKLSRPGWWSILMMLPIVNIVMMGILAWGKK